MSSWKSIASCTYHLCFNDAEELQRPVKLVIVPVHPAINVLTHNFQIPHKFRQNIFCEFVVLHDLKSFAFADIKEEFRGI